VSIWNTLKTHAKAQFLDVIQWMEDDKNTIVYRYPVFNQAIQDGGKLVVREGQFGVFLSEGKLSEAFGPGTYEISSRTKAISSFFESIKYSLNYPYKGDIFFVSSKRFTDQKWGTANPIMLSDPQIGPVRIRAFGAYAFRVTQPAVVLRELVGNQGLFSTEEINGQLKRKLVSMFADAVGESKIPVLNLASQYMDLGDAIRERLSPKFEADYGIQLVDFVVENISLPPEVEKVANKELNRLKTIPAAPLGLQTLLAGDLDVAFGPPEVVVQAANKGADLNVAATTAQSAAWALGPTAQWAACIATFKKAAAAGGSILRQMMAHHGG
jgi:membrane protease subunit (stomatin/prohibitin family)